jgi:hypothetical protein
MAPQLEKRPASPNGGKSLNMDGGGPIRLNDPALDAARSELARESTNRGLLTKTHTMRASDLCPGQGADAASDFVDSL